MKQDKPLPVMLASQVSSGLVCDLASQLPLRLPANGMGKTAGDDPSAWVPAIRLGTQMKLLALAWPYPGHVAMWGIYQQMEGLCLSHSVTLSK